MSTQFWLGALPLLKCKESSSEILTGQTGAVSLTATKVSLDLHKGMKVSTFLTGML